MNIVVDDPPQALISFRYRCDSRFELTQLEEMLIDKKSYALFVIDRSEAAYGIATGKRIHVQEHLVSNIMGKHRQGGQSAQRFERLIEEAAHNFFKRAPNMRVHTGSPIWKTSRPSSSVGPEPQKITS